MAPAYVIVRAIVEHDADNRMLEIVADSESFYRRSVVDLDGDRAPKVNELKLIDIPGGEYDVSATLYDLHGERKGGRPVLPRATSAARSARCRSRWPRGPRR